MCFLFLKGDNDMAKNFNYRKFYKEYYGIDFGSEYVIHHIDFNQQNNNINNLILLPQTLHSRYHFILSSLGAKNGIIKDFNFQMDGQMHEPITEYQEKMLINLLGVIEELKKWQIYKCDLDYEIYVNKTFNDDSMTDCAIYN